MRFADTPEQAANLRARAELMQTDRRGGQRTAAGLKPRQRSVAEITQPRINDLLRGRVSRFSIDALVNIATALGRTVHVELLVA